MKLYKGFDTNLCCRGFQYAEGKTYETDEAKLCEAGFHACEAPLDCFTYYAPAESVYHEVELDPTDETSHNDTKRVGKKIKIGARLSIKNLVDAQIEYVREHCTNENNAEPGKPVTAGDYGAATAGNRGAATAGDYGAATAGNRGAATAGYRGAATAGYGGAATAGDYGAATAGYRGAATAGYGGAATSRGDASVGDNGIACARGDTVKVKGGLGAVLVLVVEKEDSYDITEWKAVVVDGEKVKPDTWYTLENGELTEVEG